MADGPDEDQVHRQAAVAGVARFATDWADQVERVARDRPEAAAAAGAARQGEAEATSVSPDALSGQRISLAEFYGQHLDPPAGILRTPFTLEDDDFSRRGFVAAFLDPPYGLQPQRAGRADAWVLLQDVVRDILRTPTPATPIWRWRGDWCPYFDAGREWWGAAAWTVGLGPSEILVIGASSTD